MVYIDENISELDLAAALAEVSAQRREQALKFRFESGRRLSLAVYLLLKKALWEEYGIMDNPVFGYQAGGKPFLIDYPDIHFSFSHSGHVALCAISDQPVGADVEVPRQVSPSLIRFTMNDQEQAQIEASLNPTMQFFHFWTRKEALLKLTGEGIRNDMKMVLCETDGCHFETIQTGDYIYSIVNHRKI